MDLTTRLLALLQAQLDTEPQEEPEDPLPVITQADTGPGSYQDILALLGSLEAQGVEDSRRARNRSKRKPPGTRERRTAVPEEDEVYDLILDALILSREVDEALLVASEEEMVELVPIMRGLRAITR